jgi:hypothetical protein
MPITAIDLTRGPARVLLQPAEVQDLRDRGVLVSDARRERPRWFDGRFLAARDLIRDQQYFLAREADLGRSAGSGVAVGLHVGPGPTPQSVVIGAGQGVTPAGELALLPSDLTVDLADIPAQEQLSGRFGLGRQAQPPARARTGLYVLALRPVEFTANPVGAYPTSLTGARTVEDGDVIEATAVVLVPWPDDGAADALDARRSRAAHAVFVAAQGEVTASGVLPLAMLALEGNGLAWIDEPMLRRELGADRSDLPGLGFSPRALRLAHLMQHQDHLADVSRRLRGRPFAAATQFSALPPAGPLPAGSIDVRDWTQRYFPAAVDVDFSLIPDDELPALVEEALALPPIDFTASEAVLDLTAVLVLAPVPRAEFRAVLARLETRSRSLRPAAANLVAQRKPLEILQRLRLPAPLPVFEPTNPADAEWARLAQQDNLWFVRRRNLAYRDDLAGTPVAAIGGSGIEPLAVLRNRLAAVGLDGALDAVLSQATVHAAPRVIDLMNSPKVAASPTLSAATLGTLGAAAETAPLDAGAVLQVAADIQAPQTGAGLARLAAAQPRAVASKAALQRLAASGSWQTIDRRASTAPAPELAQLAARLAPAPAPKAARPPATDAPAVDTTASPAKSARDEARAARASAKAVKVAKAAKAAKAAKTATAPRSAPKPAPKPKRAPTRKPTR